MQFFATAPKGVENLLADELKGLGAQQVHEAQAGVSFEGALDVAYRTCLWSRVASRVLLPLGRFPAATPEALYRGVGNIDWREHIDSQATLAVDFSSTGSALAHTQFGSQKTKDAIVDQLRDRSGSRPSVELTQPSVRINVHVRADVATLSIDLSGDSLHRRGYRTQSTAAPMKENLAAAILLRAGWPKLAAQGAPFVDPMCGSGTLPIEAALIAGDIAPGWQRRYFGFLGWRQHQPQIWQALVQEAQERRLAGLPRIPTILGFDHEPQAVRAARHNVAQAGLQEHVTIELASLKDLRPPAASMPGLLATNPPYGERIGSDGDLSALYGQLGSILKQRFEGWSAWVLTSSEQLGFAIGLRADRSYAVFNSNVPCRLLKFRITSQFRMTRVETPKSPQPTKP